MLTKGQELWDLSEVPAENQDWLQSGRSDSQQLPQVLGAGEGGGAGQRASPVEVALPFVCGPAIVRASSGGWGRRGPPCVFIYLLFAVSADSGLSSPLRDPGFHFES